MTMVNYFNAYIRKIPDWPRPGVLFYDVTTLFEDATAFKLVIDEISNRYAGQKIDKVVGIDARGFLLASAVAYQLGAGIAVVRKKGKLPYKTRQASYEKEYGPDVVEIHEDAIRAGERVIIIDDLLATGGTMLAAVELVEQLGGVIVGLEVVVNLSFLPGWAKLSARGLAVNYLLNYDNEKVDNKIKVGIIGGSGLDDPDWLDYLENETEIITPFGPTAGPIKEGKINGVAVALLARHGRQHQIAPAQVPYQANLWALKEINCTHILAITACGSLQEYIRPGDLIFPDQFIDYTKQRPATIFQDQVVHTPMAEPFCAALRSRLAETSVALGFNYREQGTVITIDGPRFSTRAESRLFKSWGADIINMSTVPEVIIARELGLCYQAIAMTTDYDAWREDEAAVTWEMIQERMTANTEKVKQLIIKVLSKIN